MSDEPPRWRTIPHVTVLTEVRDEFAQACNLLRVHLGVNGAAHPSPSLLYMAIARIVLQAPEIQVPDQYRDDVLAGHARCWFPHEPGHAFLVPDTGVRLRICGSFAKLERHHAIPRHRGKAGHAGPLVWLCHDHHAAVTASVGGFGWRELAAALGYADLAAQWEAQR